MAEPLPTEVPLLLTDLTQLSSSKTCSSYNLGKNKGDKLVLQLYSDLQRLGNRQPIKTSGLQLQCGINSVATILADATNFSGCAFQRKLDEFKINKQLRSFMNSTEYEQAARKLVTDRGLTVQQFEESLGQEIAAQQFLSVLDIEVLINWWASDRNLDFNLLVVQCKTFGDQVTTTDVHLPIDHGCAVTLAIRNIDNNHFEGYATSLDEADVSLNGAPLQVTEFLKQVDPRFNGGHLPADAVHKHDLGEPCSIMPLYAAFSAGHSDVLQTPYQASGLSSMSQPQKPESDTNFFSGTTNFADLAASAANNMQVEDGDSAPGPDVEADEFPSEKDVVERIKLSDGTELRVYSQIPEIPKFEDIRKDIDMNGLDSAMNKLKESGATLVQLQQPVQSKDRKQCADWRGMNQAFKSPVFIQTGDDRASMFPQRSGKLTVIDVPAGSIKLFVSYAKASIAPCIRVHIIFKRYVKGREKEHEACFDFPFGEVRARDGRDKRGIVKDSLKVTFNDNDAHLGGDAVPTLDIRFKSEHVVMSKMIPPEEFLADFSASFEEKAIFDHLYSQVHGWCKPGGPGDVHLVAVPFQVEIDDRQAIHKDNPDFVTPPWSLKQLGDGLIQASKYRLRYPYHQWVGPNGEPNAQMNAMKTRDTIITRLHASKVPLMAVPATDRFLDERHAEATLGTAVHLEHEEQKMRDSALGRNEHLATIISVGVDAVLIGIEFKGEKPKMDKDQDKFAVAPNTELELKIRDKTRELPIIVSAMSIEADMNVTNTSYDMTIAVYKGHAGKLKHLAKRYDAAEKLVSQKKELNKHPVLLKIKSNDTVAAAQMTSVHKTYALQGPDTTGGVWSDSLLFDGNTRNSNAKRTDPFVNEKDIAKSAKASLDLRTAVKWDKSQEKVIANSFNLLHRKQLVQGCPGSGKSLIQKEKAYAAVQAGHLVLMTSDRNTVCDNMTVKLTEAHPELRVVRVYASSDGKSDAAEMLQSASSDSAQPPTDAPEVPASSLNEEDTPSTDQKHDEVAASEDEATTNPDPASSSQIDVMALSGGGSGWDDQDTPALTGTWAIPESDPASAPANENESWAKNDGANPDSQPDNGYEPNNDDESNNDDEDRPTIKQLQASSQETMYALIAKKFKEKAHQRSGKNNKAQNSSVSATVLKMIDAGEDEPYQYTIAGEHGEPAFDPDFLKPVNALTEVARFLPTLADHSFSALDDKGNPVWTDEDKNRFRQVWDVCCKRAVRMADVVVSTLVNCASDLVRKEFGSRDPEQKVFVEVDEAQTSSEPTMLILLGKCYSTWGKRIVSLCMYGDKNQIGLVITSESGTNGSRCMNEFGGQLRLSLFERLINSGFPVDTLRYQARMPKNLWAMIDSEWYHGVHTFTPAGGFPLLPDGWDDFMRSLFAQLDKDEQLTEDQRVMHFRKVHGDEHMTRSQVTGSRANWASMLETWNLIKILAPMIGDKMNEWVLLLVSYRRQAGIHGTVAQGLRDQGFSENQIPEIRTVDGAIGHEKRIVIIDFVNCTEKSLGFLKDEKRSCVMWSRQTAAVIAVGSQITPVEYDDKVHDEENIIYNTADLGDDALDKLPEHRKYENKRNKRKDNARAPYSIMRILNKMTSRDCYSSTNPPTYHPLDLPEDIQPAKDRFGSEKYFTWLRESGVDITNKRQLTEEQMAQYYDFRVEYKNMTDRRSAARTEGKLDTFIPYVEGFELAEELEKMSAQESGNENDGFESGGFENGGCFENGGFENNNFPPASPPHSPTGAHSPTGDSQHDGQHSQHDDGQHSQHDGEHSQHDGEHSQLIDGEHSQHDGEHSQHIDGEQEKHIDGEQEKHIDGEQEKHIDGEQEKHIDGEH
jgi:hypothetical protein